MRQEDYGLIALISILAGMVAGIWFSRRFPIDMNIIHDTIVICLIAFTALISFLAGMIAGFWVSTFWIWHVVNDVISYEEDEEGRLSTSST